MAWGKPFEAVERLPVPPKVAQSFKKLQSAERSRNMTSYGGSGSFTDRLSKAEAKIAQATEEAAAHFGGDTHAMRTHFKRFLRWGGRAMGVAEMILPKEAYEEGMRSARERVSPAITRSKPKRTPA